jgi:hypothetical protein
VWGRLWLWREERLGGGHGGATLDGDRAFSTSERPRAARTRRARGERGEVDEGNDACPALTPCPACQVARAREASAMLSPPRFDAWPAYATEGRLRAVYARKRGGGPTVERESTAEASGRSYVEDCSVQRVAVPDTGPHALARRRRRPSQVLFRLSLFEIAKLEKVTTNLKISKNKSCRGTIDLQLSQKASYVLINHLSGNVGRSCRFSMARFTVHSAFNSIFGQLALKIGMSANYKKCVPGNNEQLSY